MKTLYTIGIDFGTSNSCVCYASYNMHPNGTVDPAPTKRPEALSVQHSDTIPTVVFLGDAGQPALFGEIAEERAVFYPDLTRTGFKLDLGKNSSEGAEAFLLTKQFLGYLRSKLAEVVPLNNTGDDIVVETYIGHPVQWTADQREETLRAAREAGFPNVRLEGESMSAVYCHLCETGPAILKRSGSLVMMIDMGGGTTDFAFLRLSSDPNEPPTSQPVDPALIAEPWGGGKRSYGGRDLDALLLDYFLRFWGDKKPALQNPVLMREMRRFKERFSANISEGIDRFEAAWLVDGQQKTVRLDRETFDALTAEYRAYFPRLVQASLELAGVAASEVSAIILTGGHSQWYFVDAALQAVFPHIRRADYTLLRHNHPEQSVARGLCYGRMVLSQAGESRVPLRKATHSIWVGVSFEPGELGMTTLPSSDSEAASEASEEPVLMMPEGRLLPYRPTTPVTLAVQRLALTGHDPLVAVRLYSGLQEGERLPLIDRRARFRRGALEDILKRISRRLPWTTSLDEDRFLVDVFCHVDENEMISGKVVVTRYWRSRVMAVQTQPLRIDSRRRMRATLVNRGPSSTMIAAPA